MKQLGWAEVDDEAAHLFWTGGCMQLSMPEHEHMSPACPHAPLACVQPPRHRRPMCMPHLPAVHSTDTSAGTERLVNLRRPQRLNHFPGMLCLCMAQLLLPHSERLTQLLVVVAKDAAATAAIAALQHR